MSLNRKPLLFAFACIAIVVSLASAAIVLADRQQNSAHDQTEIVEIEIAEDVTSVVFDEAPLFDDGYPAHGNAFITSGYIYPKGTLNGSNGVIYDADGSPQPEFPDEVLGTWVCYGRAFGEAAHAATGPWAVSTQIFQFNEAYDNASLITHGFESMEINVPFTRIVTGGSGSFMNASGEVTQQLLGMVEETGAVNISAAVQLLEK